MWFNNTNRYEVEQLQKQLDSANDEIKRLERSVEYHQKMFDDYQAQINDAARNASIVIDFREMKPFSIERQHNNNELPKTILGYMINDDKKTVIKEWYLTCSDDVHAELVTQFADYLKSR